MIYYLWVLGYILLGAAMICFAISFFMGKRKLKYVGLILLLSGAVSLLLSLTLCSYAFRIPSPYQR